MAVFVLQRRRPRLGEISFGLNVGVPVPGATGTGVKPTATKPGVQTQVATSSTQAVLTSLFASSSSMIPVTATDGGSHLLDVYAAGATTTTSKGSQDAATAAAKAAAEAERQRRYQDYLRDQSHSGEVYDAAPPQVFEKKPFTGGPALVAVAIGLGAGFLIGRSLR